MTALASGAFVYVHMDVDPIWLYHYNKMFVEEKNVCWPKKKGHVNSFP